MRTGDTILAVASPPAPPGSATHALIRLSGPDSLHALAAIGAVPPALNRGVYPVRLAPGPHTLPATLMVYPAPKSYTGEDSAELLVVHNQHLIQRLLEAILAHPGVRMAGPGEFSARAYLNARLTLDQAQGIAALISARSEAEWTAARDLAQGAAGQRSAHWADTIARLLALTEAGIDFTDQEDVVAIEPQALAEAIRALIQACETKAPGRLVRTGAIRVALVGPPNAGKSTLFNALLGRRRSLTSDQAGTTRDAIIEPLDLRPLTHAPVELIDLPGLDAQPISAIDAMAREQARHIVDAADLLVQCSTMPVPPLDERAILVRTKADRADALPPAGDALPVCAIDARGLPELRNLIAGRVESLTISGASAAASVVPSHAHALRLASTHLQLALDHITPGSTRLDHAELIAGELRLALDALAPIVGRIEPDEILGRIFASFCIGK